MEQMLQIQEEHNRGGYNEVIVDAQQVHVWPALAAAPRRAITVICVDALEPRLSPRHDHVALWQLTNS